MLCIKSQVCLMYQGVGNSTVTEPVVHPGCVSLTFKTTKNCRYGRFPETREEKQTNKQKLVFPQLFLKFSHKLTFVFQLSLTFHVHSLTSDRSNFPGMDDFAGFQSLSRHLQFASLTIGETSLHGPLSPQSIFTIYYDVPLWAVRGAVGRPRDRRVPVGRPSALRMAAAPRITVSLPL